MKLRIVFIIIALFPFYACSPSSEQVNTENQTSELKQIQVNIVAPTRHDSFKIGEDVTINYKLSDTTRIDSIGLSVNNGNNIIFQADQDVVWKSADAKTGQNHIRLSIFIDSMTYYGSTSVRFFAAKAPELLTYRIKETYNHDPKAYTQGLMYVDGFLYESTGQHGESTLRKVDYKTGKVLQMYDLAKSDFGEGIARVGDKIYMLTWESKKGYVFDLKTFNVELEFPLTSEGWGLTYDGEYLIRSDGSNVLYFIDPEYLTEVRTLEVYDHKSQVSRLNELEYYDGKIWANVYGEDYIVTIDPKTGAVIEKIDFSGLLTKEERRKYRVDVLNGIAWSNDTHQLFVTGKLWPKLFEVELKKLN